MKSGGYTDGELRGSGFSPEDIAIASGLPPGVSATDVKNAGCSPSALAELKNKNVSAAAIRRISGCDIAQLKAAGFSVSDLKDAGFSAAELKNAGFSADQLKAAGFSPKQLLDSGFTSADLLKAGFSPNEVRDALNNLPEGVSIDDVRQNGCNLDALKKKKLRE